MKRIALYWLTVMVLVSFMIYAANTLDDLDIAGAVYLRGGTTFYGANTLAALSTFSGDFDLNDIMDLDAADASLYAANIKNTGAGGGLFVDNASTGDLIHFADGGVTVFAIEDGCAAASATWDPGNLGDAAQEAKDFTVTGAALGDQAFAGAGVDVQDMTVTATVTLADTVTVVLANETGGALDLASSTWYITVIKTH